MNHESLFRPESQERLKEYPHLITISGHSGAGKTRASEEIAIKLNRRCINGGQLIRISQREKTGANIVGATDRSMHKDLSFDVSLAYAMKESVKTPMVVESRLAGLIAKGVIRVRDENGNVIKIPQNQGVLAINIRVSSNEIRFKRLQKTINKRDNSSISLQEVEEFTKEREKQDVEAWINLYPELKDLGITDPYDPEIKTYDGRKVYDITIDTQDRSREETAEELIKQIRNWGKL